MFMKRLPQEIRFLIFSIATISLVLGASSAFAFYSESFIPIVFEGVGNPNLVTVTPGYPPVIDPYAPPPTATPIPTPTPVVEPVRLPIIINPSPYSSIINQVIHFRGAFADVPFEGVVTAVTKATVLAPDYGDPIYPQGVFLVVFMDVTNHGLESDDVGYYSSFRIADSTNRKFDLAILDAQIAAEDQFGFSSVYTTIQPGFTTASVFVFDVLPTSEGFKLVSLSTW